MSEDRKTNPLPEGENTERPTGVQLTRVGLWFGLFGAVIVVAGSNTGNNALYMLMAAMMAVGLLSVVAGKRNLRALEVEVSAQDEVFAGEPASIDVRVSNSSAFLPRWLVQIALSNAAAPALVVHLRRRRRAMDVVRVEQEVTLPARGRWRPERMWLSTLFPFGLFRISRTALIDGQVLVYPRLLAEGERRLDVPGQIGEEPSSQRGFGHDLYGLREMRRGDDPRDIHWKQSARTGRFILRERAREQSRRLAIVLDNAVGPLAGQELELFEFRVREAATAGTVALAQGFEIELLTRDDHLPSAGGARQRRALLEALALVEVRPRQAEPLELPRGSGKVLRLGGPQEQAARRDSGAFEVDSRRAVGGKA